MRGQYCQCLPITSLHLNVQEPSCILQSCLLSLAPALSTGMMVNVSESANCACAGLLRPDQPGQLGLDTELGLGLAASSLSILSVNLPG